MKVNSKVPSEQASETDTTRDGPCFDNLWRHSKQELAKTQSELATLLPSTQRKYRVADECDALWALCLDGRGPGSTHWRRHVDDRFVKRLGLVDTFVALAARHSKSGESSMRKQAKAKARGQIDLELVAINESICHLDTCSKALTVAKLISEASKGKEQTASKQ